MMSLSHFFKHLPGISCRRFSALSRRGIHPPRPSLALLFMNLRSVQQLPVQSSLVAKISAPSCSYTSVTETEPEPSTAFPYLLVRIRCRKNVAVSLSEALLGFGASSACMDEDIDDFETSDEVSIDSIFPEGQDVAVSISQASNWIGLKEIPSYEVQLGEQYDWVKKTQESFVPIEVTEGLWIVPEWKTPPVVEATNIILNPGLAFGTGEHATTKLCLLLLHRLIKGGELFLDYGTGSGILAIAALKFGASLSVGVDIDPQAITSASQNAELNNIDPEEMQLHLVPSENSVEEQTSHGSGIIYEKEKFDVVIANILLNPLLQLADHIVSYAKPGATIGLSGILYEQLPDILNRYSPFLDEISVEEMDDWACVTGIKKTIPSGSGS